MIAAMSSKTTTAAITRTPVDAISSLSPSV
jgi:hypothetical protein